MCGIVGVVSQQGDLAPEIARAIRKMANSLSHRGPDGEGYHVRNAVALGHRRLAIIDIDRGHQPMANEDGSCWVIFNGEIYNHHDLRQVLQSRGHRFITRCDTEVIIHAYEEFGVDCAARLEGMFAFAVYDERKRELYLARDRLGKKPLFYANFEGFLHFGSEIKALRRSPVWDGSLDTSALEGYLCMGYFPAPHTIFKHVRKLEPGHWLRMRNGEVEVRRYWDVEEFDTDRRALPLIEAELEEMLGLAVHRRLESEVPLGAFLSGGIDSGLIVSFMCDTLGPDVLTATVGFGQEDYNEIPASRLVAERFKSQHVTEVVEPDLSEILGPIVGAFDEPFADDSAIPTYYVSMMARRHVTVALSGDGGDESFGGYDFRYVPHAWECRLRPWLSAGPAQSLLRWLGSHWSRSTRMPRALRLGTVCENLARSAADAYYLDLCFQKPADARRLLGEEASPDPRRSSVYEAITSPYRRCPSKSALQRAQYADLKVYLPNMPLVKVDRMSMHHSLEIRSPLLDHSVVEFAFRVPTESKLPKLEAKHLLRRLAQRRLPPELLQLPKQGFSTPIGNWIRGPLREQFQDEVFSSSSRIAEWLDIPTLRSYFTEHCRRRVNRSWALWSVWVLERWCQLHMEEELRPVSGRSLRD